MGSKLGDQERPLRTAIVGSGPSGFYAADALINSGFNVEIVIFDRLPAPFGLVRYGVAPDHPKIKNVIKVYERIVMRKNVRFLGNVSIGTDMKISELKRYFDAVIFACGAETDRSLGIHGEDLAGSHTATEFVGWYNGHPDYRNRTFDLSGENAVIIGQGNVAMDVARILCKTVDELKKTDIAQHALEALAQSHIKTVHLVGRRGPAQAKFTPAELREFGELADCDPLVDPNDLDLNETSRAELEDPKNSSKRKNLEMLQQFASAPERGKNKRFIIHFLKSPMELRGAGKVEEVILERNRLEGEPNRQKARLTGETEKVSCDLFFRSVGYRGVAIANVPFDHNRGIFHNVEGRIARKGEILPGLYCAGWIKRGPSGVIGTNKADSDATVKKLLEDVEGLTPCEVGDNQALIKYLKGKGMRIIEYEDWKKIDAAEIERGQKVGKPREKFVSVEEMLAVLG